MKKFTRTTVLLHTAVLIGVLLGWLSQPQDAAADNPDVINIAYSGVGIGGKPQVGGTYIATAHERGMLEEEFRQDNIQIRWHFFKGAGPATNEAFANHLIDFGFQGDLPSTVGKAGGLKTKIILSGGARLPSYVAVTADSTAASIEDLKGRKVAIFKGTANQLAAARILDAHGLSEKDLRVYNMDTGTASAAIASKDVEGIFSGVDLLALRDRGVAKIIFSVQGQEEKFSYVTSLLVTEEFAAKYPEITKRVVKVMLQAAQWSSEEQNRDPLFLLWAKSGTPFSHFKESYDGPLKLRNTPLMDDFFVARYKATVEDCKKFGLIRAEVNVDQWIDRSFLEAALQELNLLSYWQPYDVNGKPQSVLAEAPRSGR